MNPRRILLAPVALLCFVALAGCGGSNKTATVTGASATTAGGAAATAAGAPTTTVSGTGAASGTPTTTIDFKGSGSGSLCDYAKDIESSKALENAFTGKQDAKTTKDGFTAALTVIATAVSKAPSEIKADLQTLQAGFKTISDFYASYDYDITKLTAAMQKDPTIANKFEALNSDAFSAASDRVDAYFAQVCGIKSSS